MNQTIDRDNLIGSSLAIESIKYILQEIQEGYFDKLKPDDNDDIFKIIYDFKRNSARVHAISILLNEVYKEFKENKLIE